MNAIRTLGLAATLLTSQAFADVTYHYTGNLFTHYIATGGAIEPTLGTFLTGDVVFSDAITEDFSGTVDRSDILSLTLTSGLITLASSDANVLNPFNASFKFENGSPNFWLVLLQQTSLVPYDGPSGIEGFARFDLATENQEGASGQSIVDEIQNEFVAGGANVVFENPGTWARVNPVPVPGALWLLGSALGGLGAMRRRRAG